MERGMLAEVLFPAQVMCKLVTAISEGERGLRYVGLRPEDSSYAAHAVSEIFPDPQRRDGSTPTWTVITRYQPVGEDDPIGEAIEQARITADGRLAFVSTDSATASMTYQVI